jgi:hypothetical protein
MTRRRLLRRAACIALALLAFAQAAGAAMGCTAMRVADGSAIMLSGEPCDMFPGQPGVLVLERFAPDALDAGDSSPLVPDGGGVPVLIVPRRLVAAGMDAPRDRVAHRILGPPPLLATRRWRI